MSTTGEVPARGRRHPMSVVTQARRYAEAGWKPTEIVRLLAAAGVNVTLTTVSAWTDPTAAERQRSRAAAANRRRSAQLSGRLGTQIVNPTAELKMTRVRALRDIGVSCSAIAKVMRFDFGDDVTEDQIRHALMVGHYSKRVTA